MKTLTRLERTCAACFLLVAWPLCALSEPATNRTSELFYGETTNGFRGEIELVSLNGRPVELAVWANHVSDTNHAAFNLNFMNFKQRVRISDGMITNNWDYWMATNSFCGPIEIRDSQGRKLAPLKPDTSGLTNYRGSELPLTPDVAATNAYPLNFDLVTESARHFRRFRRYSGPGIFPVALFLPSPRSELVRFVIRSPSVPQVPLPVPTLLNRNFQLEDYFDIGVPDEYTLTVWPKIYKRLSATNDFCERIDLPPVSVRIVTKSGKPTESK